MIEPKKKSGVVGAYVGQLANGAKGALGFETAKLAKSVLTGAVHTLRASACPRCGELSFYKVDDTYSQCQFSACGMHIETAQAKTMQTNMMAAIVALAKGATLSDIAARLKGAKRASRALWIVSLLLMVYALSWVWEQRYGIFVWSAAVSFAIAVHALRYAFRVWQTETRTRGGIKRFLLMPTKWFV